MPSPQQVAEEWGLMYWGPTLEECLEDDRRGDYDHDIQRQAELDAKTDGARESFM